MEKWEKKPTTADRHVAARHVDAAVSYQIEAYRASSTAQRNSGRVRASDSRRDHGPVKLSPAVPTKSSPVATGTVPTGGRPARVPPSYLGSRVQPNKGATTPKGSKAWPPVDDDLYVAPLNVRRGNQAPPASTRAALISASETSHDGAATTPTQRPRPRALNQADAPASIPSEPLATAPRSYPAVPARSPHRPRPRSPPPPPPLTSSADPSPSSISPALHSLALSARKPTPPVGAHSLRQDTSPFLGSSKPVAVRPAPEPAWVLPSSRFSATTCASSNPDTPRQSALPPLPARPHLSYSSWVTDSSADDRSVRATADADAASPGSLYSTTVHRAQSPVERKGDRTPRTLTMDTQSVDCRSSIMSMAKPLPLAPPELSASQDRIAQLTAYIESLIHRRLNICKSIQQMTELMPIDSLFASEDVLRKREAEKLKVQALRDELAEIKHAEYDAGLKLHRARKRLERDSDYEQTTLWVRRATGEDGA